MVQMDMYSGTAPAVRDRALELVEQAVFDINDEYIGENPGADDPIDHMVVFTQGDTGGFLFAELDRGGDRPMNSDELIAAWRERVGFLQEQFCFSYENKKQNYCKASQ